MTLPDGKAYFDGSFVNEQVRYFNMVKAEYDLKLIDYDDLKKKYDAAVLKVEGELKDVGRVIGEKRGGRGNRETSLTMLPERPVMPVAPAEFTGMEMS